MEAQSWGDLLGMWLGVALSLFIFSFLYKDNPLYKLAEHIFVGVSAGYWMCIGYWQVLHPNLILRLQAGDWRYGAAAIMGVMLLMRIYPRWAWMGRWPLAFMVGIFAGYNIVYTMQAQVLRQIEATILPLWGAGLTWYQWLINLIVVGGTLCALLYFYFSKEQRGPLWGRAARVGIWVLMVSLGAAFGCTVMARLSLFIGRVMYFQDVWRATVNFFS